MNNLLSAEILEKYESIRLLERCKSLEEGFCTENRFIDYDNHILLNLLRVIDQDFSYDKKESFFGLRRIDDHFDFRLNIIPKYGIVETVFYAKNLVANEQYGSVLMRLNKLIQATKGLNMIERIGYPSFESYEEFKQISEEIYVIFEGFVKVIKEI